jgi:hypothetical protein
MSQLSYSENQPVAVAGLLADAGFKDVLSYACAEDDGIDFGLGVVAFAGNDEKAILPGTSYATLAFSADFVTSNSIDLSINGTSIDAVAYSSSHATTIGLLATEIEAQDGVLSATVGGSNNRSIFIVFDNINGTVSDVSVTGGASQASSTVTYSVATRFLGVTLRTHHLEQAYNGDGAKYLVTDTMNVLNRGRVWVKVEETVAVGDPVYLRFIPDTGKPVGGFRMSADSGDAILLDGCRWVRGASANGLAVLEINQPA